MRYGLIWDAGPALEPRPPPIGEGGTTSTQAAGPERPPPLVTGTRTRVLLALACVAVIWLGILISPPSRPRTNPPAETVAPLLGAQVESRAPARVFRGAQEVGRAVQPFVAVVAAAPRAETARVPDHPVGPRRAPPPTGFAITVASAGDVVTHVNAVAGRFDHQVVLSDGSTHPGRVVAHDPETGLVLVRLDGARDLAVPALAEDPPAPGEVAVAAGRLAEGPLVAPVFVAATAPDQYILSAASGLTIPGTPIFTLEGKALAVASGSPEVSRAVPLAFGLARLRQRQQEGRALPASLGLWFQPGTPAPRDGGVLVADLTPDGPADRAGIRPGDVLVALGNGRPRSVEEAVDAIARLTPGVTVTAEVRRGGKPRRLEVTAEAVLARRPP